MLECFPYLNIALKVGSFICLYIYLFIYLFVCFLTSGH